MRYIPASFAATWVGIGSLVSCATLQPTPTTLAANSRPVNRSPAMSDSVGEKIWLTGIKHQAEVKYSEATAVKTLDSLAGNSWTKISNITDEGIEHSDSGLRNDENAQITLVFDGTPLIAKIDDKNSSGGAKIADDGSAEFKVGDSAYSCRFLSRTPPTLICKVDRGVLGDKFEVFQRKTFLQK